MPSKFALAAAGLIGLTLASAVAARPGGPGPGWDNGWNENDWANSRWNAPYRSFGNRDSRDDREGKVDASSFVAPGDAAAALGKGGIAVQFDPQARPGGDGDEDFRLLKQAGATDVTGAPFEAAVVDQMVRAGYDTSGAPGSESQVMELSVTRDILVPAETKRKPVSGEMEVGISNRGTSTGVALNLDFSKPKKALVSTRMEARIRDKASGAVLWEGRADIATRDGDSDWGDQAIATRLAEELFKRFPGSTERPYG